MALRDDRSVGGHDARVLVEIERTFRPGYRAKRLFDIVTAMTGLVLFAPIFIIASIAIKLDSSGPVLSRETRYGYNNEAIPILKFRTTCPGLRCVNSRVTRVGRVLRRTSIDRLPELFNVLRGQMSIVGPRPYASRQALFEYAFPSLNGLKPGMTGLAQIPDTGYGFETTKQQANGDLCYFENWSLILDIKIILKVFFSPKTYSGNGFGKSGTI
jgi:lipopolysaccharide/colanic/teichoic acid biosynthesis glycosyltransferase